MRTGSYSIVGLLWLLAIPGHAAEYPAHELAALPDYCHYSGWFGDYPRGTREEYWKQHLGETMRHIHHYCQGLLWINRARVSTGGTRANYYGKSIREVSYTIRTVDDRFVLLPEMLTRRGEAYAKTGNFGQAEQDLRKALSLKPDYWPAYARLAESYIDRKNPNTAREVLKKGLSESTEKRALQRMLDELDKSGR